MCIRDSCLFVARDSSLYIGTESGGLNRYDPVSETIFPVAGEVGIVGPKGLESVSVVFTQPAECREPKIAVTILRNRIYVAVRESFVHREGLDSVIGGGSGGERRR